MVFTALLRRVYHACMVTGAGDKQMNRRERIIELATQIAQARQSLRAMETEMDRLLATEEAARATPTAKPVHLSNPDNNAPLN